ncbi:TPA: HNH endonuclease [Vibrio parahaemolyticus]
MTKEELLLRAKEEIEFAQMLYDDEWIIYSSPEMHRNMLICENLSCLYCGEVFLQSGNLTEIHIDHMDPLSLNGASDLSNTVAVCKDCNLKKSNKPFSEWVATLTEPHKTKALKRYHQRIYLHQNLE